MAKTDLVFFSILAWSVVSTTLLAWQFRSNTELKRHASTANGHQKVSHGRKKTIGGRKPSVAADAMQRRRRTNAPGEVDRMSDIGQQNMYLVHGRRHKIGRRKPSIGVDRFPFERSLDNFTRSSDFYLYIAQSNSASGGGSRRARPSPSLEWSEVPWKTLVRRWDRHMTFSDMLHVSSRLSDDGDPNAGDLPKKKMILHCIPKAASTTLRHACHRNIDKKCKTIDQKREVQSPFGYRNMTQFFRAIRECKNINHFCVQGGDANMDIINHQGRGASNRKGKNSESDGREPLHFIHMVPFRTYDDWVDSAIKQLFISNDCDIIDKMLDQCFGYRELYVELYPKMVLSLLIGQTFESHKANKGKTISRKDKHHIMLYNYADADNIIARVSAFFGMDPLPNTDQFYKAERGEGTCQKEISEKFHNCHDKTLTGTDAIRYVQAEKTRRMREMNAMKKLYRQIKKEERAGTLVGNQ